MTEIETYRPRADIVHTDQNAAVAALMDWAKSASAAREIAGHLVRTSFVPEGFRGKPDEATAAILAGIEVGLQPMAALRSFDVIQGTAAPRANTLRAIVQSQGHEVWVIDSTDTRAIVAGRRRGSDQEQRSTWTIDRAAKLGLVNKSNWKNQPQAMLIARATSEICRLIASDAILGLPYSIEELVDGNPAIEPAPVGAAGPVKRTAKRNQVAPAATTAVVRGDAPAAPATAADRPPLPGDEIVDAEVVDEVAVAEPPTDDPPSEDPNSIITNAQLKALAAALSYMGITDRKDRLDVCAALAARGALESSKDLTKADASIVLDTLRRVSALPDPEAALAALVGLGDVDRSFIEGELVGMERAS